MNLYIMSRGRAGKVTTLKWIPEAWKSRTFLVVGHNEVQDYRECYPLNSVIGVPESVTNYSQKFQYILDGLPTYRSLQDRNNSANDKAAILDDDLVFSRRSTENPRSLVSIKDPDRVIGLFEYMEDLLSEYPLVGVHPRQMGQNTDPPFVLNGRIICIQGINREKIGRVKVDQFPILADVVLNCTILARGQANAIITTFFQDHGPCQAPGGCSLYRTPDMQREAVSYLADRFPGFVKVVHKVAKQSNWLGEKGRYDYTCQWKRLYAAGLDYAHGVRSSPDTEVTVPAKV